MPLDTFLEDVGPHDYYYNFKSIADAWSGAFGRENCVFRIFDRSKFPEGDICRDFLNALNIEYDPERVVFPSASVNEALSPLQVEIFTKINQIVPYWLGETGGLNIANVELKTDIMYHPSLKIGHMSFPQAHSIAERFDAENVAFFESYFPVGTSFAKPSEVQPEQDMVPYTQVSDAFDVVLENVLKPYQRALEENAELRARLNDVPTDYMQLCNELEDLRARRSKLAEVIDRWDYRFHAAISKLPLLPESMRARFAAAASKRRRDAYHI